MNKPIIISLGGSLIFPEEIDVQFLKKFKQLILSQTKKGRRFVIITGGGKIARKYINSLKALSVPSPEDQDWMGIYMTHANANFIRLMFGKLAFSKIVEDPNLGAQTKDSQNWKILLAGGWKPGCSTDNDAVILAKTYDADTVINLSNIDSLYNKDPRKFKDATKIKEISWDGLLKITGRKWNPGSNVPFDPVAAKFALKNNLKVIIANGKNLANLKNILDNKSFIGTIIS